MVEKPAKVAALMAQWLVNGWCRETIFNLKLPMKKRYEEVSHNLAYIQAQLDEHGINAQIQARQLYHDREEVTVHVRRIWAAVGGRHNSDNRQGRASSPGLLPFPSGCSQRSCNLALIRNDALPHPDARCGLPLND